MTPDVPILSTNTMTPIVHQPSPLVSGLPSTYSQPAATHPLDVLKGSYTVQTSDTLTKIAAHFSTTTVNLVKLNAGLSGGKITAGQKIIVPRQHARLTLDNNDVKVYVSPYVTGSGYTMVSLRSLVEAKGGFLIWTAKTRKVDAWVKNTYLGVTIGKRQAHINKQRVTLPVPATLRRARTMVPIHYVADGLHLDFTYDPSSNTYIMTSE
jgi:hypothetical protein